MTTKKTPETLFGELGGILDQAAQTIFDVTVEKEYAVVYTCAQCGRHFSRPVPLVHRCATVIETTARDVVPNELLLPEGKGE